MLKIEFITVNCIINVILFVLLTFFLFVYGFMISIPNRNLCMLCKYCIYVKQMFILY